jgi:hypothetical protein
MRELKATGALPDGPDIRRSRLQPLIHANRILGFTMIRAEAGEVMAAV